LETETIDRLDTGAVWGCANIVQADIRTSTVTQAPLSSTEAGVTQGKVGSLAY